MQRRNQQSNQPGQSLYLSTEAQKIFWKLFNQFNADNTVEEINISINKRSQKIEFENVSIDGIMGFQAFSINGEIFNEQEI